MSHASVHHYGSRRGWTTEHVRLAIKQAEALVAAAHDETGALTNRDKAMIHKAMHCYGSRRGWTTERIRFATEQTEALVAAARLRMVQERIYSCLHAAEGADP